MKKIVSLLIIALLWCSVSTLRADVSHLGVGIPTDSRLLVADVRCTKWVDSVMAGLSTAQRVGQLLVVNFPAKADKQNKKQMQHLIKRYNIGGLMFADGVPEEQVILTNIAKKQARTPIMIGFDNNQDLHLGLNHLLRFPHLATLSCISNDSLLYKYGCEVARQHLQVGANICFDFNTNNKLQPYKQGLKSKGVLSVDKPKASQPDYPLLTSSMILVQHNDESTIQKIVDAALNGSLPHHQIEARCREVLTYKYMAGLHLPSKKLQVSGTSFRINSYEARALAAELRKEAITVPCNYFGVLPLTDTNITSIAVLSVGGGSNEPLVEELRKLTTASIEHIVVNTESKEEQRELLGRLAKHSRIIIGVTSVDADVLYLLNQLTMKKLPIPLVYTIFTSHRSMRQLEAVLKGAAAVVVAQQPDADVQQYVANVLFAKQEARGVLPSDVGNIYKAGVRGIITPRIKLNTVMPEELGMNSYHLHQIDSIVMSGIAASAYPGCQVLVVKDGKAVFNKCYGTHSYTDSTAVRPTDMFDIAALSQTTATLLAVMKLYDEGRLRLTDKASRYLPLLQTSNKKNLTIKDLLLHESGLPPNLRFHINAIDPNSVHGPYAQSWIDKWHHTQISEHSYFCSDFKFRKGLVGNKQSAQHSLHIADGMWMNKSFKTEMLQTIARCELDRKRYVHSDLNFILLHQVVEAIVKLPIDLYLMKEFYAPMGLQRTMYHPLQRYPKQEIMPTVVNDYLRRQDLCGYVHDEAAACMGGVSGSAGLFSTATELAKVYQMILNGGELNGKRYLSKATCQLFTANASATSRRGLGFDKPNLADQKNNYCAPSATAAVYGHTGNTGTNVWVDPTNNTIYVFLSNRMCPNVWNTKLGDMKIQKNIHEAIYNSMK